MSGLNGDELTALVAGEADARYLKSGYVDDDGRPSRTKLAETLLGPVSKAVANSLTERDDASITRDQLMEIGFPDVPGRDEWDEQPDPKLAKLLYNRLESDVWRCADPNPSGLLQIRLNGDGVDNPFVLVRRNPTTRHPGGVYITRDPACLLKDVLIPQSETQIHRATRSARLTALLMQRVPESAKKFDKELTRGLNESKSQAKAISAATMAVLTAGAEDDDDE
jgi:hypothetical protein